MSALLFGAIALGSAVVFIVGLLWGIHIGTEDTERRWSEAVSRKAANDECDRRRALAGGTAP